jgi:drug/metabolite transporter (DMT)-like permease
MMAVAVAWWGIQETGWAPLSGAAWLGIIVLAVVCTYLARVAMFTAMQRLGGSQVTLLVPLETLLTVVWSVLFLGERLSPLQWAGSGLILLSAALAARRLRRVRRT